MKKSKTEIALQELNEEILIIVKSDSENETCYFPDSQKMLESFQNYLKTSGIDLKGHRYKLNSNPRFFIFQENISLNILLKYQRFINLIESWEFIFKQTFKQILSSQNQFKAYQHFLPSINMTEIMFLMYLCLEVERKEIIGKIQQQDFRNMFLLKQIIKILEEFYSSGKIQSNKSNQINFQSHFSINQDKFVKILLLKALKIKLQRQNFSFATASVELENLRKYEKVCDTDQKNKNTSKPVNNNFDENFSIISIQSDYNPSIICDTKNDKMKQSMAMLQLKLNEDHFKLEMKNLSSEQIFKYISLNDQFKDQTNQ